MSCCKWHLLHTTHEISSLGWKYYNYLQKNCPILCKNNNNSTYAVSDFLFIYFFRLNIWGHNVVVQFRNTGFIIMNYDVINLHKSLQYITKAPMIHQLISHWASGACPCVHDPQALWFWMTPQYDDYQRTFILYLAHFLCFY